MCVPYAEQRVRLAAQGREWPTCVCNSLQNVQILTEVSHCHYQGLQCWGPTPPSIHALPPNGEDGQQCVCVCVSIYITPSHQSTQLKMGSYLAICWGANELAVLMHQHSGPGGTLGVPTPLAGRMSRSLLAWLQGFASTAGS